MEHLIAPIAKELNISVNQIKSTLALLEEGNTVPFIARYRKEMTGGLMRNRFVLFLKNMNIRRRLQSVRKMSQD